MTISRRTFVQTAAELMVPAVAASTGLITLGSTRRASAALAIGSAPSYMDGLADFQVRALTGAYAPADGKITVDDATPQVWRDAGSGHQAGLIYAWTGGGKGRGSLLHIQGGGHVDGDNNGLYQFDFAGGAKPNGWSVLDCSDPSAVRDGNLYTDGKPASLHSYDGLVSATHNDAFYRFGGVPRYLVNASFSRATFKFTGGRWTQLATYPGAQDGWASTFYDATTRKIFVSLAGNGGGYFFRCDDETWSSFKSHGQTMQESCGAFDPTRNRGILPGTYESGASTFYPSKLMSLNFASETATGTTFSLAGATEIVPTSGSNAKISCVYDGVLDCYWLFGGQDGSPGWRSLYQLNANGPPWNVTKHTLTGDPIMEQQGQNGSYGRFVFMEQWRAIGLVAGYQQPAYLIKLPGTPPIVPKPPTGVTAG
jgi:hypothetical protein